MEHVYYLTKICYASLGMKRNITKKLRSIPKEKENHPRGHKDQEGVQQLQNSMSQVTPCAQAPETPCPRATQEPGAGAPRAHGRVPCPRDPRAHGPDFPRAHGPPRMAG